MPILIPRDHDVQFRVSWPMPHRNVVNSVCLLFVVVVVLWLLPCCARCSCSRYCAVAVAKGCCCQLLLTAAAAVAGCRCSCLTARCGWPAKMATEAVCMQAADCSLQIGTLQMHEDGSVVLVPTVPARRDCSGSGFRNRARLIRLLEINDARHAQGRAGTMGQRRIQALLRPGVLVSPLLPLGRKSHDPRTTASPGSITAATPATPATFLLRGGSVPFGRGR